MMPAVIRRWAINRRPQKRGSYSRQDGVMEDAIKINAVCKIMAKLLLLLPKKFSQMPNKMSNLT